MLGARSWIGFRLGEALQRSDPSVEVGGTSSSAEAGPEFLRCGHADHLVDLLERWRPDTVVNLLRGEDESSRAIHQAAARRCELRGIHYTFASSALALDGYRDADLLEDMPARSVSPYGQFKAACEQDLLEAGGEWLVVRFASIHGWSPWKPSRTAMLLEKLAVGETIRVDRGVRQNRLHDKVFAEALAQVILDRRQGTIHLGATDASEEIDFLCRVADAFGQGRAGIEPGAERRVNLVVRPERLRQLYGNRFLRTEQQTIGALLEEPELQRYKTAGR